MLRPRTPAQIDRLMRHLIAAYHARKLYTSNDVPSLRMMWAKRHDRLSAGYKVLNGRQSKHYSIA